MPQKAKDRLKLKKVCINDSSLSLTYIIIFLKKNRYLILYSQYPVFVMLFLKKKQAKNDKTIADIRSVTTIRANKQFIPKECLLHNVQLKIVGG